MARKYKEILIHKFEKVWMKLFDVGPNKELLMLDHVHMRIME